MDAYENLFAIVGCEQAVHRFYSALDASDFPAVGTCFAPEGVWHRQGAVLLGPDQVLEALAKRPAGRTTAHLVQNLVVSVEAPTVASVEYMTLVYRVDADLPASGVVELGLPFSISLNKDRMTRGPQNDWVLLEKRSARKFGG